MRITLITGINCIDLELLFKFRLLTIIFWTNFISKESSKAMNSKLSWTWLKQRSRVISLFSLTH